MQRFSGRRLSGIRKDRELSREQLAVAISKSHATIVAYERAVAVPPGDVVGALADALGCSVADLYDAGQVAA